MARYLVSGKALYQHIPRTGGTWVERAISMSGVYKVRWITKQPRHIPRKHGLLQHYWNGELNKVHFVFAFVRHPVSWYESNWQYLHDEYKDNPINVDRLANPDRRGQRWTWHPQRPAARQFHINFNEWVKRMLANEPMWCTRTYEWYCGPEGGEFCNFIGRQETLTGDFLSVMKHLGYKLEPSVYKQIKRSKHLNTRSHKMEWAPGLKERVEKAERLVIERFYSQDTEKRRHYAGVSIKPSQKETEILDIGGFVDQEH